MFMAREEKRREEKETETEGGREEGEREKREERREKREERRERELEIVSGKGHAVNLPIKGVTESFRIIARCKVDKALLVVLSGLK